MPHVPNSLQPQSEPSQRVWGLCGCKRSSQWAWQIQQEVFCLKPVFSGRSEPDWPSPPAVVLKPHPAPEPPRRLSETQAGRSSRCPAFLILQGQAGPAGHSWHATGPETLEPCSTSLENCPPRHIKGPTWLYSSAASYSSLRPPESAQGAPLLWQGSLALSNNKVPPASRQMSKCSPDSDLLHSMQPLKITFGKNICQHGNFSWYSTGKETASNKAVFQNTEVLV